MRKLAEKTMNATHEVAQNISTIQNSIRNNISEVTNAVDSVAQAMDLANSSGQALNEIVTLVTSNSQLVLSIATAAENKVQLQTKSIVHLAKSIVHLAK